MARTIAGVVVGYLVMVLVVVASFSLAYLAMGADAAFKPVTYEPSVLWIAVSFALGFIGAVLGGWVCAAIARTPTATTALAVILLVLGVVIAIPSFTQTVAPKPRLGPVGHMEAMQSGQTPAWVAVLNPIVGAVGVMLGGRLRKRQP